MPAKYGCLTPSSGTRRWRGSTRSSPPTSTSGSSLTVTSSTASGRACCAAAPCTWLGSRWTGRPVTSTWPAVIIITSYSILIKSSLADGWTKTDLIYIWKSEGALQFAANLSLPGGFLLANTGNKYCDVVTSTGEYSCLQVDLLFSREVSYYIITIYLPTFMIVMVSWFSFWIDHKSVSR